MLRWWPFQRISWGARHHRARQGVAAGHAPEQSCTPLLMPVLFPSACVMQSALPVDEAETERLADTEPVVVWGWW